MWMIVGDTHLTDNARDAYRFRLFDWLAKQQRKNETVATFLAGDITDAKDRHSATLVNKIVEGLLKLKPPVYIAMGNHDYRDPRNPFFKFLNHIEGIHFVTKPTVIKAGKRMAVIPHYRKQNEFDEAVDLVGSDNGVVPDSFLVHQTFAGAIAESGVLLNGLSASLIESLKPPLGVYAGDVHRPQTQGAVTYIGCPYHVRFGDDFNPRVFWVDQKGKKSSLYFDAPFKWSLTVRDADDIANNERLAEGDQVKLTVEVPREEMVDWKATRAAVLAACKKLKLEVHGIKLEVNTTKRRERISHKVSHDNTSTVEDFCRLERVSKRIRDAGIKIIGG